MYSWKECPAVLGVLCFEATGWEGVLYDAQLAVRYMPRVPNKITLFQPSVPVSRGSVQENPMCHSRCRILETDPPLRTPAGLYPGLEANVEELPGEDPSRPKILGISGPDYPKRG